MGDLIVKLGCGPWRKSSYSLDGTKNCIEVAEDKATLAVRDSKDPDGPRLGFASREWGQFLARVRATPPRS